MWRGITLLLIVTGMAGAAVAQDEAADAKARAAEGKARNEAAVVEKRAVIQRLQADEAAVAAERAAVQRAHAAAGVADRATESRRVIQYRQALAGRAAAPREVKKETVPYCGVSTSEVIPVLAEQLKMTRGMGLVVDFVEPGSPAEAAGVKQHDVLTKFNDQLLTNPEQLRVLVRLKKPSDDVKLSLVRRGEPTSVNVELGQKEVEVEVEKANADVPVGLDLAMGADGQLNITPRILDAAGGGGILGITNVNGRNQAVWADDQHTLTTEMSGGKVVRLTAKDRAGNEIFSGPVETDEQRKALPAEIADKLTKSEAAAPVRMMTGMLTIDGGGVVRGGGGGRAAARPRVLTSTDKETLMLARFENGKAAHVFAFSQADGKTLFDGPVATDEQRKALPAAVLGQLEVLEKNQAAAGEFGVVGRN